MKLIPLKNKEGYVESYQIRDKKDVHPSHITKVFEEEDIKNAVEYLKDELIRYNKTKQFTGFNCRNETIINIINDAFEDVK